MRRKDREKDRDFALKVIDRAEYGTLALTDRDGRPYCVPLSLVRCGEVLYFHSAQSGKKAESLSGRPEVWVSFVGRTQLAPEEYSTFYESAMVRGKAEEVTDTEEKRDALFALCRKYAPDHLDRFEAAMAKSLAVTAVWKVTMDEVTGKAKEK